MKALFPWMLLALFLLLFFRSFGTPKGDGGWELNEFRRLPVLHGGRIKPLDTVGRTALLMIHENQTVREDGKPVSAARWLLNVMARPEVADEYRIFRINNPDVLGHLHLNKDEKDFSFSELVQRSEAIAAAAKIANETQAPARNLFERSILKLYQRMTLYHGLKNSLQFEFAADSMEAELAAFEHSIEPGLIAAQQARDGQPVTDPEAMGRLQGFLKSYEHLDQLAQFAPLPPRTRERAEDDWDTMGEGLLAFFGEGRHPMIDPYVSLLAAWRAQDKAAFSAAVRELAGRHDTMARPMASLAKKEEIFNRVSPFTYCMLLYVGVFVFAFLSWIFWQEPMQRGAYFLLIAAFVLHLAGLCMRIYLQGRPPVTNLYSSAVFVGIVAVALGIVLERVYRMGIGSIVASGIGFSTLVIAYHLSMAGDTMEMMRAVLDSNFWLSTHVVTITVGYGATYLAGALALIYIFRGLLTRGLDENTAKSLTKMVYGTICFATFFSFVGTILGGIWADQSWGRFWGWDPKENGALLIVLWNVIILHARWGGLIKQRGLMALAVFGNIVTSWSWWGVNMLGIGLHSYGFMDEAFKWLAAFCASQLLIIGLAMIPLSQWPSFSGGRHSGQSETELAGSPSAS